MFTLFNNLPIELQMEVIEKLPTAQLFPLISEPANSKFYILACTELFKRHGKLEAQYQAIVLEFFLKNLGTSKKTGFIKSRSAPTHTEDHQPIFAFINNESEKNKWLSMLADCLQDPHGTPMHKAHCGFLMTELLSEDEIKAVRPFQDQLHNMVLEKIGNLSRASGVMDSQDSFSFATIMDLINVGLYRFSQSDIDEIANHLRAVRPYIRNYEPLRLACAALAKIYPYCGEYTQLNIFSHICHKVWEMEPSSYLKNTPIEALTSIFPYLSQSKKKSFIDELISCFQSSDTKNNIRRMVCPAIIALIPHYSKEQITNLIDYLINHFLTLHPTNRHSWLFDDLYKRGSVRNTIYLDLLPALLRAGTKEDFLRLYDSIVPSHPFFAPLFEAISELCDEEQIQKILTRIDQQAHGGYQIELVAAIAPFVKESQREWISGYCNDYFTQISQENYLPLIGLSHIAQHYHQGTYPFAERDLNYWLHNLHRLLPVHKIQNALPALKIFIHHCASSELIISQALDFLLPLLESDYSVTRQKACEAFKLFMPHCPPQRIQQVLTVMKKMMTDNYYFIPPLAVKTLMTLLPICDQEQVQDLLKTFQAQTSADSPLLVMLLEGLTAILMSQEKIIVDSEVFFIFSASLINEESPEVRRSALNCLQTLLPYLSLSQMQIILAIPPKLPRARVSSDLDFYAAQFIALINDRDNLEWATLAQRIGPIWKMGMRENEVKSDQALQLTIQ